METQVGNTAVDKKEYRRQYDRTRYQNDLDEMRRRRREYYYANKERILANAKKTYKEKHGENIRGRPKKYIAVDGEPKNESLNLT